MYLFPYICSEGEVEQQPIDSLSEVVDASTLESFIPEDDDWSKGTAKPGDAERLKQKQEDKDATGDPDSSPRRDIRSDHFKT